jgi:hypothetical protein
MRTKLVLIVAAIPAFGFIATLASGFYKQNLSTLGVSRIGYGFPLSWHGHSWVVYPDMPVIAWFSWEPLLLDIAFWSLVITIPVTVAFWRLGRHFSNQPVCNG